MHLHLSWHATRQLTLSIGCLAGALTNTGCRPKFYSDHHAPLGCPDGDDAPAELEVAEPERETEAERPGAYALPRPIVRPLPVETAEVEPAAAADEATEAEVVAAAEAPRPERVRRAEPPAPAAIEVVDLSDAEPEAAEPGAAAASAPAPSRPQPSRSARRRRQDDRDPALRSFGGAVGDRGLGAGASYGLSLTGGNGNY